MPFSAANHYLYCEQAVDGIRRLWLTNPACPCHQSGWYEPAVEEGNSLGESCAEALAYIQQVGAAPRYNPLYLRALGIAEDRVQGAMAAIVGWQTNEMQTQSQLLTVYSLANGLRDPLNMGTFPPIPNPWSAAPFMDSIEALVQHLGVQPE